MNLFSKNPRRHGFTLVEVIITLAIMVVLATVSIVGLSSSRRKAALDNNTAQIAALLREAQSNSMAQNKSTGWGVRFDNINPSLPFYDLFYGKDPGGLGVGGAASNSIISAYPLAPGICYATSSIARGSYKTITFSQITGLPSATATIILQLMTGGGCGAVTTVSSSASLTRTLSGKVFFDDFNRSNL